ncbi:MAG: hypothetical protein JOS17DRAFT_731664 [Linnemannia elongata]|nr:MAG: hypothetical protein JOS17DRAFT_731664 [Linnemannia elongata]
MLLSSLFLLLLTSYLRTHTHTLSLSACISQSPLHHQNTSPPLFSSLFFTTNIFITSRSPSFQFTSSLRSLISPKSTLLCSFSTISKAITFPDSSVDFKSPLL